MLVRVYSVASIVGRRSYGVNILVAPIVVQNRRAKVNRIDKVGGGYV